MKNKSFERPKRILSILLAVFFVVSLAYAFVGTSSFASSCQMTETKSVSLDKNKANNFTLNGVEQHKDVHIDYSTNIVGEPIFRYSDSENTSNFEGKEIRTQETEIGTMVTVTLESAPDDYEITLTLLVPTINLDEDNCPEQFESIAIRTTRKTPFVGEGTVEGAVQSYEVISLNGTANYVLS